VKAAASGPVARTSSAPETPLVIAGPGGHSAGTEGAATGSRAGGSVVTGSWPYRQTVAQALTLASPRRKWSLSV
jgi:hypothetical protein